MKSNNFNIDRLVNTILNEEIQKKASEVVLEKKDVWMEIVGDKDLHEKWDKDTEIKKTGEHSDKSISQIDSEIKKLKDKTKKYKDEGKAVPEEYKKKISQLYFAKRAKKNWPSKGKVDVDEMEASEGNAFGKAVQDAKKSGKKEFEVDGKEYKLKSESKNLRLSETELIKLIEEIVLEQKVKDIDEKTNISTKEPEGYKKTMKALAGSKKENEDYIQQVTKKLTEYIKDGSKGGFEMNPKHYPKGNGELGEMKKKAYKASSAVEEYIENFAYAAGLDELAYDEIQPKKEWVEDNIKGSSKTGNNPKWANAVETDLGERIFKKSEKKPYTTEKRKGSYKRQTQPIDSAGEHDGKKSIDDMFAKLESTEEKKSQVVNEDVIKMKSLISYSRKTQ